MPAAVADLIKTTAAIRYLNDISPVLFPNQSVSNSIDGITQSVSINTPQLLQGRFQGLEKKKIELTNAFKKQFAKTIGIMFIGS
jgi:hypothetical protein